MSETRHIFSATSLRPPALTFSRDWVLRPLFGSLLAGALLAALFAGTFALAVLVAVCAVFALREWYRIVSPDDGALQPMVIAVATLSFTLLALALWPRDKFPWFLLGVGALVIFALALARGGKPIWQAGGLLYVGIPALTLVALRAVHSHGAWLLVGLFIIIWSTDTGALVAGNLLRGPKIAPVLSPNKTWSGTLGGILAAAIAESIYVGVLGGHALLALMYGAGLAVFAHAGDFFESGVKRRFSRKDSGSLIPGHGGALDRLDSTFFAATALGVLVWLTAFDPFFGARL